MKKIMWLMQLVIAAAVLCGCASKPLSTTPPLSDTGVMDDYRIGVGDALQINVWRNPELTVAVPVRPDGKISMPLIGDVVAASLTATELSQNITKSLSSFVRSPQVTVIVSNPSSSDFQRRVRITGAVKSPQSIPFREGMTVLDLVLIAGGPNEFASANKARLYRKVNGELKVYKIRLDDLMSDGEVETNYPLQPSDIVSVPERAF